MMTLAFETFKSLFLVRYNVLIRCTTVQNESKSTPSQSKAQKHKVKKHKNKARKDIEKDITVLID